MANSAHRFHLRDYLAPRHWPTWLGLGLLRLLALLPHRSRMGFGGALGGLMYYLLQGRRRVATVNVNLAFPALAEPRRAALVREHFCNAGRAILESAASWWGSDRSLLPLAHLYGGEHLEQAIAAGKGVVLLSAHFTCFELGGRLLAMRYPFCVLYKPQRKNPLFESLTTSLRLGHYRDALHHRDMRGMVRALRRGEACWYLPDQDIGRRHSVFAPFMGVATSTVTATARLARMSGARVVPYFPLRRDDGRGYDIHILPALEGFPSGDDVADASRINALVEEYVRRAPAQYLWLHKRFKTRPEGELNPYE